MSRPTNRGQLEKTLSFLAGAGRLSDADAAMVQALRSIAGVLDGEPGNASLWRQYVRMLEGLTGGGEQRESFDDAVADLLADIRDEAPPGA